MSKKLSAALVVGGSSGIGLSTVNLLKTNWDTYAASRQDKELPDDVCFLKMDVLDEMSIEATFELLSSRTGGRLHALVYSAGISTPIKCITDFDVKVWDELWNTNVTGAILTLKYAYPLLKKAGGRVVLVNSLASRTFSRASGFEYTASKAALTGLAHQLAMEWASDGILINSVYPGMTLTPMLKSRLSESEIRRFAEKSPTQRILTPEEVANAIDFLISPNNKQMTGTSIDLNGGLYLT